MARPHNGRRKNPNRIVGSCYVCRQPVRAPEATRVKDEAAGVRRLVHTGDPCEHEMRRWATG